MPTTHKIQGITLPAEVVVRLAKSRDDLQAEIDLLTTQAHQALDDIAAALRDNVTDDPLVTKEPWKRVIEHIASILRDTGRAV